MRTQVAEYGIYLGTAQLSEIETARDLRLERMNLRSDNQQKA